jgi:hypothetical protein
LVAFVQSGVYGYAYPLTKVVGVFVRFRAPLHSNTGTPFSASFKENDLGLRIT